MAAASAAATAVHAIPRAVQALPAAASAAVACVSASPESVRARTARSASPRASTAFALASVAFWSAVVKRASAAVRRHLRRILRIGDVSRLLHLTSRIRRHLRLTLQFQRHRKLAFRFPLLSLGGHLLGHRIGGHGVHLRSGRGLFGSSCGHGGRIGGCLSHHRLRGPIAREVSDRIRRHLGVVSRRPRRLCRILRRHLRCWIHWGRHWGGGHWGGGHCDGRRYGFAAARGKAERQHGREADPRHQILVSRHGQWLSS